SGKSAGVSINVSRVGTLTGIHLVDALAGASGTSEKGVRLPVNFTEAKTTDEALYAQLFHDLLREGVALAPGAYEALFVGLAHDDAVLDDLAERLERAVSR
ncbi:MAG: hypothetical protein ACKPBG_03890, partial [Actinomycetota bacterium]